MHPQPPPSIKKLPKYSRPTYFYLEKFLDDLTGDNVLLKQKVENVISFMFALEMQKNKNLDLWIHVEKTIKTHSLYNICMRLIADSTSISIESKFWVLNNFPNFSFRTYVQNLITGKLQSYPSFDYANQKIGDRFSPIYITGPLMLKSIDIRLPQINEEMRILVERHKILKEIPLDSSAIKPPTTKKI